MIYQEMVEKLKEFPVLVGDEGPVREDPKAAELRMERNRVGQEIESLLDKVAQANEILMTFINRRVETLAAEQEELERELAVFALNRVDGSRLDQIRNYLSRWDAVTLDDRRKVAGSLIEAIYATSENVEICWKI